MALPSMTAHDALGMSNGRFGRRPAPARDDGSTP
jgi:hypothetical protein